MTWSLMSEIRYTLKEQGFEINKVWKTCKTINLKEIKMRYWTIQDH